MGAKEEAQAETKMDMTPMIDVTFQLIIFFMLLMDMSTKELEELVLPKAPQADPDKPDPKDPRPGINIVADGRILVKRAVYYDPQKDDGYAKVKGFPATASERIKQADRRMKDEVDYGKVKERIAKRIAEKEAEAIENAKKDKLNR